MPCNVAQRTLGCVIPCVCVPEEEPQCGDGVWPNRTWGWHEGFSAGRMKLQHLRWCQGRAPGGMPESGGTGFTMTVYVDCNIWGNFVTRWSRTGYAVFLNGTPIYWFSKKQASCEVRTFGLEFTAMRQAVEYVRGLHYKLWTMGIACEEPIVVYGDNMSVLSNTTVPVSTLKKKMNSMSYHFICEGCFRGEWWTVYVNTHLNCADFLTKGLPVRLKRSGFIRKFLYWLW